MKIEEFRKQLEYYLEFLFSMGLTHGQKKYEIDARPMIEEIIVYILANTELKEC